MDLWPRRQFSCQYRRGPFESFRGRAFARVDGVRAIVVKPITVSEPIAKYYGMCVDQCAAWFGSSGEAAWPTEFYEHDWSNIVRDSSNRCYRLALARPIEISAVLAEDLAEQSFRRVCCFRQGPWKTRWVYHLLVD